MTCEDERKPRHNLAWVSLDDMKPIIQAYSRIDKGRGREGLEVGIPGSARVWDAWGNVEALGKDATQCKHHRRGIVGFRCRACTRSMSIHRCLEHDAEKLR